MTIHDGRMIVLSLAYGPPAVLAVVTVLRWQRRRYLFAAATAIAAIVWLWFFNGLLSVHG